MIQKTNARTGKTAVTAARPGPSSAAENNEQTWGSWSGNKYYTLEVVQHPLRARMCGFGDKDRRPLAPAAVAKMTVRHENNEIAEIGDIDVAFFVVTVDLWSADGKHEMNLVLHPSSADRYIPTNVAKPRRRATASASNSQRGADSQSSQSSFTALPNPATTYAQHTQYAYQHPPQAASAAASPDGPAQQPPAPSFSTQPYPPPQDTVGWAYPPAPPLSTHPSHPPPPHHQSTLPSIHTFHQRPQSPTSGPPSTPASGVPPPSGWQDGSEAHPTTNLSPYRAWAPPSADQHQHQHQHHPPPPPYGDHGSNASGSQAPSQQGGDAFVPSRYPPPPEASTYPPPPPPDGAPVYAQAPYPQAAPPPPPGPPHPYAHYGQHQYYGPPLPLPPPPPPPPISHQPSYAAPPPARSPSPPAPPSVPPVPRHTYTRTLVGPLSANACRLNDEHRKPGIFFLFQDLSIRTEGTFRLRMRLMNVGAPPAPEPGATRVMTGQSPILAQTFTDSFIVYSAKRFPGVPDTTALSIAFGNQGQKLPLRNRHGSRNSGRRRRRGDSEGSEEESDGGR